MSARTLIVGDVHGCADELSELLQGVAPQRLLLVGDLFTKGPDPLGVWRLITAARAQAVLGNHDEYVLKHRDAGAWRALPPEAWTWLEALPLFLQEEGLIVVHAGLHPERGVAGTDARMATRIRRWPDDRRGEASDQPFWWEGYGGPGLVVYGHDARRGLVDRRPRTLGLDTGCVYGNKLSGYILEEDRLVQVPARRIYHRA